MTIEGILEMWLKEVWQPEKICINVRIIAFYFWFLGIDLSSNVQFHISQANKA